MRFVSSEYEVKEALNILDKLIYSNPINTIESIQRYKNRYELDMFTSFKMKKELSKIN